MNEKTTKKLAVMDAVLVKLEDAKNTQESLMEKLSYIEVELFEIQSKDLDKELDQIKVKAGEIFDAIGDTIEQFEIKRNKIENESE